MYHLDCASPRHVSSLRWGTTHSNSISSCKIAFSFVFFIVSCLNGVERLSLVSMDSVSVLNRLLRHPT